jgi:integrase
MGSIYKRGKTYWIKYYRNGVAMRESAGSDKEKIAKDLLKEREGAVVRGVPVTPRTNRVTFDELAADVVNDYRINGKRSLDQLIRNFELHVTPFFGGWKAANITTADVRKYIDHRQAEDAAARSRNDRDGRASNATINRELSALTRAFSLGVEAGKLTFAPKVPKLKEQNARKGFFERAQYERLRAHLKAPVRAVVTFLYITGWRVDSEVLPLQWRQVDLKAGTVRLDPGTTKNGEGRVFPMTAELRALLDAQRTYTDAVQREQGIICPNVFHRHGKPIKAFRVSWLRACKDAGCLGMIRHDFRRTAVRNLVRAGIPERVAMTMTGHKTRVVFERYNIVSEGDLAEAARKLDAAAEGGK